MHDESTFEPHSHGQVGIPEEATSYAFSYPLLDFESEIESRSTSGLNPEEVR